MDLSQANKDYRKIGDVPFAVIEAKLQEVNSPMLATAKATHAAASPHSALFWAQCGIENRWETTGILIHADDHNPVSMRPWLDKNGKPCDPRTKDGLPPGNAGVITASDKSQYLRFHTDANAAAEWKYRVTDPTYKGGVYNNAHTVKEMTDIYCPPGDVHPVTGVANEDIHYADVVIKLLTEFADAEAKLNGTTPTEEPSMPDKAPKLCFIIVAGHRSDGPGGVVDSDPTEESLTGYCAESDVKALRAAGYDAFYWQRDLDGDNDPTMTTGGGLDRVALGVAAAIRQKTAQYDLVIMIDEHYNGPHSPVHVIVPDTVGLHTAYAGGAPAGDTAANNTLDVQLAAAIAQNAAKNTGMELFHGLLGVPGVMSERETGVAIQYAARLAMFAASSDSQAKCIRIIFEHGGYQDAPAKQNDFTDKCSAAVVAAVKSVFGAPASQPVPDKPKPTPDVPDLWPYAKPLKPSWWDDLISGKKSYVIDHGTIWIRTNNQYRVIRETDRDQTASTNAKDVGPRLPVNTTFGSAAVGQSASNKKGYAMTGMFTRVLLDDLAFVAPDTEGGKAA